MKLTNWCTSFAGLTVLFHCLVERRSTQNCKRNGLLKIWTRCDVKRRSPTPHQSSCKIYSPKQGFSVWTRRHLCLSSTCIAPTQLYRTVRQVGTQLDAQTSRSLLIWEQAAGDRRADSAPRWSERAAGLPNLRTVADATRPPRLLLLVLVLQRWHQAEARQESNRGAGLVAWASVVLLGGMEISCRGYGALSQAFTSVCSCGVRLHWLEHRWDSNELRTSRLTDWLTGSASPPHTWHRRQHCPKSAALQPCGDRNRLRTDAGHISVSSSFRTAAEVDQRRLADETVKLRARVHTHEGIWCVEMSGRNCYGGPSLGERGADAYVVVLASSHLRPLVVSAISGDVGRDSAA